MAPPGGQGLEKHCARWEATDSLDAAMRLVEPEKGAEPVREPPPGGESVTLSPHYTSLLT